MVGYVDIMDAIMARMAVSPQRKTHSMSAQPNILMIMSDQMTPLMMSAYGEERVQTPHLDQLAKTGVRFDAAYSSCPLCTPARMALMAGQYVSRIGAWDNGAVLHADVPTFCHHLAGAGYDTVLTGKMHFAGPDQLHGFKKRLTTDIYPSDFSWTPDWTLPGGPNPNNLPHTMSEWYTEGGPGEHTVQLDYDEETHHRALEYLREKGRAASSRTSSGRTGSDRTGSDRTEGDRTEGDDPFFMCVSYSHPHSPYFPPQQYWDMYEGADLPMPQVPDDLEATRPQMDRWLNGFHGCERVDMLDPANVRRTRQAYAGLVTYIDDKVGELLGALEKQGLRDDTIILFFSDHGDMLCERGMAEKRNFYEWSARIPLIANGPGIAGGRTCVDPVGIVDIFPTLVDMGGCALETTVDGMSLHPYLTGGADHAGPGYALMEYHGEGVFAPSAAVRQGPWKYIETAGQPPRLYNLAENPGEWTDLFATGEHNSVVKEMQALLRERFDYDAIETAVRDCQQRRLFIRKSMQMEPRTHWNYKPDFDVDGRYLR
jgi:choline-sulfatase